MQWSTIVIGLGMLVVAGCSSATFDWVRTCEASRDGYQSCQYDYRGSYALAPACTGGCSGQAGTETIASLK
jgi:hypothetical protein